MAALCAHALRAPYFQAHYLLNRVLRAFCPSQFRCSSQHSHIYIIYYSSGTTSHPPPSQVPNTLPIWDLNSGRLRKVTVGEYFTVGQLKPYTIGTCNDVDAATGKSQLREKSTNKLNVPQRMRDCHTARQSQIGKCYFKRITVYTYISAVCTVHIL